MKWQWNGNEMAMKWQWDGNEWQWMKFLLSRALALPFLLSPSRSLFSPRPSQRNACRDKNLLRWQRKTCQTHHFKKDHAIIHFPSSHKRSPHHQTRFAPCCHWFRYVFPWLFHGMLRKCLINTSHEKMMDFGNPDAVNTIFLTWFSNWQKEKSLCFLFFWLAPKILAAFTLKQSHTSHEKLMDFGATPMQSTQYSWLDFQTDKKRNLSAFSSFDLPPKFLPHSLLSKHILLMKNWWTSVQPRCNQHTILDLIFKLTKKNWGNVWWKVLLPCHSFFAINRILHRLALFCDETKIYSTSSGHFCDETKIYSTSSGPFCDEQTFTWHHVRTFLYIVRPFLRWTNIYLTSCQDLFVNDKCRPGFK